LCLDDLPEPRAPSAGAEQAAAGLSSEDLVKRNAELQKELDALAQQFNRYRLAVQQTLDTRWAEGDADATANGPSTPGKGAVPGASSDFTKPENDYSESYFASYARNGKTQPSTKTKYLMVLSPGFADTAKQKSTKPC
jgi:protein arginine N-methyltransferase 3